MSEKSLSDSIKEQQEPAPIVAKDHLHFKAGVDFADVTELFNMVKSGTLMENRTVALDKTFWLAGGINAYFDNHPDPEVFKSIAVPNELEGEAGLQAAIQSELDKEPSGLSSVLAAYLKKLILIILQELLA